jgi:hypothetical protein
MKTKYLLVSALGLWTAILSFWVVTPAITALRAQQDVPEVAITLLVLGVLLAFGGSRVAWDGLKHLNRAG